jgi:hypothetical protein
MVCERSYGHGLGTSAEHLAHNAIVGLLDSCAALRAASAWVWIAAYLDEIPSLYREASCVAHLRLSPRSWLRLLIV